MFRSQLVLNVQLGDKIMQFGAENLRASNTEIVLIASCARKGYGIVLTRFPTSNIHSLPTSSHHTKSLDIKKQ